MGIVLIIVSIILIIVAVVNVFSKKSAEERLAKLAGAGKQKLGEFIPLVNETKAAMSDLGSDNVIQEDATVMGKIKCSQPLMSPIGNVPCVYYTYKVTNKWTERYTEKDSNGHTQTRTRTHEDVIDQGTNCTRFTLDDGTGSIMVDPQDGTFEGLSKSVDRTETQFPQNNSGPSLQIGSLRLDLGSGNMRNQRPESVKYVEEVIGLDRTVTVVGTICDAMGDLCVRGTSKNKVIVSTKSADDMVADTKDSIKSAKLCMNICGILGVVLLIIGIICL